LNASLLKLLLVALCLDHRAVRAEDYAGRIVGVIDGDTVDLLTDAKVLIRVRLSGIDAPERKQAFGNVSKKALSDFAFDRRVVVVASRHDRYGRLIGKVMVSGVDANLQMVRFGLAWHFKKYEKEQAFEDRQRYADAELKARARHVGLWTDKEPVAPWDFRHHKKELNSSLPAAVGKKLAPFAGSAAVSSHVSLDMECIGHTMHAPIREAARQLLGAETALAWASEESHNKYNRSPR